MCSSCGVVFCIDHDKLFGAIDRRKRRKAEEICISLSFSGFFLFLSPCVLCVFFILTTASSLTVATLFFCRNLCFLFQTGRVPEQLFPRFVTKSNLSFQFYEVIMSNGRMFSVLLLTCFPLLLSRFISRI